MEGNPMYKSGVKVDDFIESLVNEADIEIEIPMTAWLRWLNAVEQFAYTEILKDYVLTELNLETVPVDVIDLRILTVPPEASAVQYDDVMKVYGENGTEIPRGGASSAYEFPEKNLYYGNALGQLVLNTLEEQARIGIVYRLRPALKTEANMDDLEVALPPEYLDMAAAKMRGEAYKIANEDQLAAKWLQDYNMQVENFKVWAASRNERFGA